MKIIGLKIKSCLLPLLLALTYADTERKSLSEYPVRSEIVVSLDECVVMPGGLKHYRVSSKTKVKVLKENLTNLKAREVWAVIDQEKIDYEFRVLNYERKIYTNSVEKLKQSFDVKREEVLDKVAVIEEEKYKLQNLSSESDLSAQLKALVKERQALIEDNIAELMKEIDEEEVQAQYALEQEALDLAIDKKEKSYLELVERSQLTAPFSGVLELNFSKIEPVPHEYEIEANTLYATITDDSRYELQMKNQNSVLNSKDVDEYFVILGLGGQKGEIRAGFQGVRREEQNGRLRKVGIFEVEPDSVKFAKDVVEEKFSVFVMKKLPKDCHIVRKNDIALLQPEILQSKGWKGLANELWPGSEVIEVGLYDLAVISKGEQ